MPVAALLLIVSCSPDDRPELGDQINDLKIVVTPAEAPNTYVFTTNRSDVIGFWTLGNGATASGVNSVTSEYPFAGNYNVTLEAYGSAGRTNNVSITINVPKSNFTLLQDPIYNLITGGINNPEGKTWMVDSLRRGHIVKNPQKGSPDWIAPEVNKKDGHLYDDEVIFKLTNDEGPAFIYKNNGGTLGAQGTAATLIYNQLISDKAWQVTGTAGNAAIGSDRIIYCTPPMGMTWTLIKDAVGTYHLSFPRTKDGNGGFLFYYMGWTPPNYEIRKISETHMIVWKDCPDGAKRELVLISRGTPSNNDPIEWGDE